MAFTTLKGRTHTSLAEINITPFVDVVLVLLIIFMLTAPILESGIEVDLPKTHTVKAISDEKVVVTIDKHQNIYVGNDPVNIHRLVRSGPSERRRHHAGFHPLQPDSALRHLCHGGGRLETGQSDQHQRGDGTAGNQVTSDK
jgi:hypothetical protein